MSDQPHTLSGHSSLIFGRIHIDLCWNFKVISLVQLQVILQYLFLMTQVQNMIYAKPHITAEKWRATLWTAMDRSHLLISSSFWPAFSIFLISCFVLGRDSYCSMPLVIWTWFRLNRLASISYVLPWFQHIYISVHLCLITCYVLRRYELKEEFADPLMLCRKCRILFWQVSSSFLSFKSILISRRSSTIPLTGLGAPMRFWKYHVSVWKDSPKEVGLAVSTA